MHPGPEGVSLDQYSQLSDNSDAGEAPSLLRGRMLNGEIILVAAQEHKVIFAVAGQGCSQIRTGAVVRDFRARGGIHYGNDSNVVVLHSTERLPEEDGQPAFGQTHGDHIHLRSGRLELKRALDFSAGIK